MIFTCSECVVDISYEDGDEEILDIKTYFDHISELRALCTASRIVVARLVILHMHLPFQYKYFVNNRSTTYLIEL